MTDKSGSSTVNGSTPHWRVLLATGSMTDQKLAAGLLAKHGHEVSVARTGPDALQQATTFDLDVLLLDWSLPELDGVEVVRAIREREKSRPDQRRIAILFMGDENEDVIQDSLVAGADGLVGRPLSIPRFTACMARAAQLRHEAAPGFDAPAHDAPAHDIPAHDTPAHDTACRVASCPCATDGGQISSDDEADSIDWAAAMAAVDGHRQLLIDLIALFHTEFEITVRDIRQALDDQHPKALHIAAHRLKGCLRYFGKTRAGSYAKELEQMGRSGQLAGAEQLWRRLAAALDNLLPQLQAGPP